MTSSHDDIVARLRKEALVCQLGKLPASARLCDEAAAEIKRLRADLNIARRVICFLSVPPDADSSPKSFAEQQ